MRILSKLPVFKYGTIDYQVKFYIKKYASLLQQGLPKDAAVRWIMEFYLQGESYDRRDLMENNFNNYVNNIDFLICTIMIYYFHYDGPKHYPIQDIISDTAHYLDKYKAIYMGTLQMEGSYYIIGDVVTRIHFDKKGKYRLEISQGDINYCIDGEDPSQTGGEYKKAGSYIILEIDKKPIDFRAIKYGRENAILTITQF